MTAGWLVAVEVAALARNSLAEAVAELMFTDGWVVLIVLLMLLTKWAG